METRTSRSGAGSCPFSRKACRDCAFFRGKHYFFCHPDASWDAVCRPAEETEAAEDGTPWFRGFFSRPAPAGLALEDLAAILPEVSWDFWPEEEASPMPARRETGPAHFAVDVWCGSSALFLMRPECEGRPGWVPSRVDAGIPEALLAEAVLECGGRLHFAGAYPVNGKVKAWLLARIPGDLRRRDAP